MSFKENALKYPLLSFTKNYDVCIVFLKKLVIFNFDSVQCIRKYINIYPIISES